jgi:hypothetical protein
MPCDMKLYPADWQQIRARILSRAGNRCENCRVCNYAVGYRDESGKFHRNAGNLICDASGYGEHPNGEDLTYSEAMEFVEQYNDCYEGKKRVDMDGNHWIVIVLTIAHMDDSDPQNCDDSNLKALCQRCHNRHDMPMRKQNAKRTMMQRKAVGSLFTDVPAAS